LFAHLAGRSTIASRPDRDFAQPGVSVAVLFRPDELAGSRAGLRPAIGGRDHPVPAGEITRDAPVAGSAQSTRYGVGVPNIAASDLCDGGAAPIPSGKACF